LGVLLYLISLDHSFALFPPSSSAAFPSALGRFLFGHVSCHARDGPRFLEEAGSAKRERERKRATRGATVTREGPNIRRGFHGGRYNHNDTSSRYKMKLEGGLSPRCDFFIAIGQARHFRGRVIARYRQRRYYRQGAPITRTALNSGTILRRDRRAGRS